MPLGGSKDKHFSCLHSSCQLGLNYFCSFLSTKIPLILWKKNWCGAGFNDFLFQLSLFIHLGKMELIFRQDHRLVCPCQIFQMMTQWILGNPNSWISNVNHHLKIQISPRLVHTGSSMAKFHEVDQISFDEF